MQLKISERALNADALFHGTAVYPFSVIVSAFCSGEVVVMTVRPFTERLDAKSEPSGIFLPAIKIVLSILPIIAYWRLQIKPTTDILRI